MQEENQRSFDKKRTIKIVALLFTAALLIIVVKNYFPLFYHGFYERLLSVSNDAEIKVNKEKESYSLKNKEGEFSTQKTLPGDFPADFPIYPDAQLEASWSSAETSVSSFSVVWQVSGDIEAAVDFYAKELAAVDWRLSPTLEGKESTTYALEKGMYNGFIGIAETEPGVVVVSLTLRKNN